LTGLKQGVAKIYGACLCVCVCVMWAIGQKSPVLCAWHAILCVRNMGLRSKNELAKGRGLKAWPVLAGPIQFLSATHFVT
jgi:hypothetical protein